MGWQTDLDSLKWNPRLYRIALEEHWRGNNDGVTSIAKGIKSSRPEVAFAAANYGQKVPLIGMSVGLGSGKAKFSEGSLDTKAYLEGKVGLTDGLQPVASEALAPSKSFDLIRNLAPNSAASALLDLVGKVQLQGKQAELLGMVENIRALDGQVGGDFRAVHSSNVALTLRKLGDEGEVTLLWNRSSGELTLRGKDFRSGQGAQVTLRALESGAQPEAGWSKLRVVGQEQPPRFTPQKKPTWVPVTLPDGLDL